MTVKDKEEKAADEVAEMIKDAISSLKMKDLEDLMRIQLIEKCTKDTVKVELILTQKCWTVKTYERPAGSKHLNLKGE